MTGELFEGSFTALNKLLHVPTGKKQQSAIRSHGNCQPLLGPDTVEHFETFSVEGHRRTPGRCSQCVLPLPDGGRYRQEYGNSQV